MLPNRQPFLPARRSRVEIALPAGSRLFRRGRVIPLARLNLEVAIARTEIDAAERAVALLVGGSVSNCVLAAQLVLQLCKNVWQRMLFVHTKNAPTGLFRHPFQRGVAHASEVAE